MTFVLKSMRNNCPQNTYCFKIYVTHPKAIPNFVFKNNIEGTLVLDKMKEVHLSCLSLKAPVLPGQNIGSSYWRALKSKMIAN